MTFSKKKLYKRVEAYFIYEVNKKGRKKIISKLYHNFNISREKIFSDNEIYLNWGQIKEMNSHGVSFGSHGSSHSSFSYMSYAEKKEEIVNSKKVIEQNIGKKFIPFSYPFGQKKDVTSDTKTITRKTGHHCVLTAEPTLNSSNTCLYELGRIHISKIPVYLLAFEMEKGVLRKWLGK
jgi:peptidoglycan/xylan/chitin deacetylase (PgdA/CDA1 family)